VAGIRADIASEYFYKGRINESLAWLDSCYKFETVDETSFLNGAFIYSELGYYDNAQSVLNNYSKVYGKKMDRFYYGLRLFADTSDNYVDTLNAFCAEADSNAYSTEYELARRLIALRDTFSFAHYEALTNDNSIPDYYKSLIYARGLKQFSNRCELFVLYGMFQAIKKNYSSAVQFLDEAESCEMQHKEFAMLTYGYTLYHLDKTKALVHLQKLYASSNIFYQQAAKYFSVLILREQKQLDRVEILRKELITAAEKTKYVDLANKLSE
jgi:hypothetical protein